MLGCLLTGFLLRAAEAISPGGSLAVSINFAHGVFPPKKSQHVVGVGNVSTAANTRPICLKNNMAKTILATFPIRLKSAPQVWISTAQRGMVSGRVPLHGPLEIDSNARQWRRRRLGVLRPLLYLISVQLSLRSADNLCWKSWLVLASLQT